MTRIYYVEDDENIATLVKTYLMQKGYTVSIFSTISEAQKALECHLPDLILVDWNMPDGKGDALCEWIRERWMQLPIIFLTVRNDTCDIVSGFKNGADDFIVKPFELEVLYSRIAAILRRAGNVSEQYLTCEGISIDKNRMSVFCQEEEITVSQSEYQLLLLLIREMIGNYFNREGFEVINAENGKEGLALAREKSFSVILLDIMMPQMGGYEMLAELRKFSDTPVILLTARGEQMSKIKGFTKGCDDYVVKPFDFAELSLRIQAILKRTVSIQKKQEQTILTVRDLTINLEEHTVFRGDEEIVLTQKEYEILCVLASNKGRVYSTRMLYELIWECPFLENDKSVITHMRNLREKIGDKVKDGTYIKTIWGAGYKIEKEN